jgi:hypothetical protein
MFLGAMRTCCLLATVGVVALAAPAAGSPAASRCRVGKHERVVVRGAGSVVADHHRVIEGGESATDQYSACLASTGRWFPLGSGYEYGKYASDVRLYGFQLRGRYVTFVYDQASKYVHLDAKVEQYDLSTGRRRFVANYEPEAYVVDRGTSDFPEMVSDAEGDAAWVLREPPLCTACGPPETEDVIVHDRNGTSRVASYATVEPFRPAQITSLRISPQAVSWLHLGGSETVPLG